jgi:hypothetical protein
MILSVLFFSTVYAGLVLVVLATGVTKAVILYARGAFGPFVTLPSPFGKNGGRILL